MSISPTIPPAPAGGLSQALQAASPLLLGMASGIRAGRPNIGIQQGLAGMLAQDDRKKSEAMDAQANEAIAKLNIDPAKRALLQSMPASMRMQAAWSLMNQKPAAGRQPTQAQLNEQAYQAYMSGRGSAAPQPTGSLSRGLSMGQEFDGVQPTTPLAFSLGQEMPQQPQPGMPMEAPAQPLSFGNLEQPAVPQPVPLQGADPRMAAFNNVSQRANEAYAIYEEAARSGQPKAVVDRLWTEYERAEGRAARLKPEKAAERAIIKGADGFNYYQDTQERVLPGVSNTPAPGNDYERYVARETAAGREPLDEFSYREKVGSGGVNVTTNVNTKENDVSAGDVAFSPGAFIDQIDDTLNDPALDWSTGALKWAQIVPGSPMRRFKTRADQLSGQAFMAARQALKGGGQITDFEGKRAEAAFARFDDTQSPEDYRVALLEARKILGSAMLRQRGWIETDVGKIYNMSASDLEGLDIESLPPDQLAAVKERANQIVNWSGN